MAGGEGGVVVVAHSGVDNHESHPTEMSYLYSVYIGESTERELLFWF